MRIRTGKHSLISIMALTLSVSLVACGSGSDQGKTSTSAVAKDGSKSVELTLWHTWTTDQSKVENDKLKAFQEKHPEIKLKIEAIPHDQYKIKLKTNAAGKQLPDVFQVWPGAELKPLVDAKVIAPLDEIVGSWKDTLIPADSLTDYQVDGKQYAIPGVKNYTHVIYYDKDMLAKAGFNSFPSTYDDFKKLVSKLTEQNITPIALGNKGKWVLQSSYISTIGDRFTGSDFIPKALSGEKKFTDPEFIAGLKVIEELARMKAFNSDMNNIDNNQQRDPFLQGKTAMMIEGSWALTDLISKMPKDKYIGTAFFPTVEGGKGDPKAVSSVVGTGLGYNGSLTGDKKAAAETFLKFFYDKEYYQNRMSAGTVVPAKVDLPADLNTVFKDFVTMANETKKAPVYDAALPANLTDTINNGLQALTTGQITPEKLAEDMQKGVKK